MSLTFSQFIRAQPVWKGRNPHLTEEIIETVWKGRASSTVRKYCLSIRKFLHFCRANDYPLELPFTSGVVAEYLILINRAKAMKGPTDSAKCAIKWLNSFIPGINKWNEPLSDEFLGKISSSIQRRSEPVKNQKKPLSGRILKSILEASDLDNTIEIRDCLVLLLSFSLLLRHDELSHISCEHIQESEGGFKILIPKSKTDQLRNGRHVFLADNTSPSSPASLLRKYLGRVGLSLGMNHFLFCPLKPTGSSLSASNRSLSYSSFRELVQKSIAKVGLDPKEYGTHSGRAGGATSLASKIPEHELLVSGRWKDARSIRSYVQLSDEHRLKTNSLLQSSLDNQSN